MVISLPSQTYGVHTSPSKVIRAGVVAGLFPSLKVSNLQAYQAKKSGDSTILFTHEPGDRT
ncbi:hypothetical protein H6G80_31435 [Nostoc sp. FACHB-87]|uniref:hypothetical protein n=1 Tax=Nostocaceae TaxID=1162 RepID=UPI001689D877|nr:MULTISPECIES: hypothetical protein [Nostocaceae]MBD2458566.1 hypothetical protein [Nostoc sp. FACHB-87]MBD2479177.1 hypothetical protein [Anabaena sp. FACHB-83]